MSPKSKNVLIIISTILPAVLIIGSGIAKLTGRPAVVRMLSGVGVGPYVPFLGVTEIIFAVLFVIPKTRRLGFVLLCCYFGGAIATVFSHGGAFLSPALLPLVLIGVNMLIRDLSFFVTPGKTTGF